MRTLLSTAKVNLLFRLPVSAARRNMQINMCKYIAQEHVIREKQLLIDVSVIIRNDSRTGIQRVVRALLMQLITRPPVGYKVRPVYASRKHKYHYAPEQFGLFNNEKINLDGSHVVKAGPGDIFLGLDLSAHLMPLHKTQLAQWKNIGVNIHVIVYDLLPVLYPRWFNAKTTKNFQRWLRTIAIISDSFICISNTVKEELYDWMYRKYTLERGALSISTIPLGADIDSSGPSKGLPRNSSMLLAALANKPTVLMVGTLEPRKGHGQVLDSFELLWQRGRDINLVIVGKPGWKTEELQRRLRSHPEYKSRLHWLDNASDEMLKLLYINCTGVITASLAEGYGLPLTEAIFFNKPILARNLPVFHENDCVNITFFSVNSSAELSEIVDDWLIHLESKNENTLPVNNHITWEESCKKLQEILFSETSTACLNSGFSTPHYI